MALTIGNWTHISMGNKKACFASVTGDGTTTTILVPLATVEYAEVTLNAGAATTDTRANLEPLSLSSSVQNQITYANAVASTKVHTIFAIGH